MTRLLSSGSRFFHFPVECDGDKKIDRCSKKKSRPETGPGSDIIEVAGTEGQRSEEVEVEESTGK